MSARGIFMNPSNVGWQAIQFGAKPPANLAKNPTWGTTTMETSPENPYLPVLWWVGLIILVIAIRWLSNRAQAG